MKELLKKSLPHILAIVVLCLASMVYFYPQLEGKRLSMDDIVAGSQAAGEVEEYTKKTGKETYLWSNAQFGGMPRLMWVPMKHNKIHSVLRVFELGMDAPIGLYFSIMIFAYFLYFQLGCTPLIAVPLAIVTALATPNVMLWQAGHYSKIATLAATPLLILGVFKIFEQRRYLFGWLIFSLGLTAALYQQHPQMTYYIFLMFGVYAIVKLVEAIRSKQFDTLLKGGATVLLAGAIAFGANSTRMLSVYDYSKQTLRGPMILTPEAGAESKDGGLDFEYAMQWSSDWRDVMASYVLPGFVGGGSAEKVSRNSESFKKYRIERAPLYWGQLLTTVGPMYMGVSLFFLFVLGLFLVKGSIKWWIGLGTLFLTLCAMGSHIAPLNKLLFDILPMYNKFRAPQSILNAVLFFLPLLAIMAFMTIEKVRSTNTKTTAAEIAEMTKKLYIATGMFLVPLLGLALFGTNMFDFSAASDQRYVGQGVDVSIFVSDRKDLFSGDAWRSFFLVALVSGFIWLYLQGKLKKYIAFPIIGVLIVFDVWGVSNRYIEHSDFKNASRSKEENFAMRPVDQQIRNMEKDRARYRVQDMTINTNNSSQASYFHNTVGGYDPAKLRRFQDVLTKYIAANNQAIYNMLNTKYFIVNTDDGPGLQVNVNALGNAWFVKNIAPVQNPDQEFNTLARMDPANSAVVLVEEFTDQVGGWQPSFDPAATIELVTYEPDRLVYRTSAASDQLAVFSEIWYNGNRDWKSYIDGQEQKHIRANYLLRAMRVPSGQHEIVFEFKPVVYAQGESISMVSWWLLVMGCLGVLYFLLRPEWDRYKAQKTA